MTKATRGSGAPMQLKDSRETLILKPTSSGEQHRARLTVCTFVLKEQHEHERAQIDTAKELLDILGLLGR